MTDTQLKRGDRLTIHNATKEQLKRMVEDRDKHISRLYREMESMEWAHKQHTDLLFTKIETLTNKLSDSE